MKLIYGFLILIASLIILMWCDDNLGEQYTVKGTLIGKIITQDRNGLYIKYHLIYKCEDGKTEDVSCEGVTYFTSKEGQTCNFIRTKSIF